MINKIKNLIAGIKLATIGFTLTLSVVFLFIAKLTFINRRWFTKVYFRWANWFMKIDFEITGEKLSKKKPLLCISNHISALDILVYAGVFNPVFVPKSDIAKWPVVGQATGLSGNIFINRNPMKAKQEVANLSKKLDKTNDPILIFPEGTSSSGSEIKRFKSAMFQIVEHQLGENFKKTKRPITIQPMILTYWKCNGEIMTAAEREEYAYYKQEDTLIRNFMHILKNGRLTVRVHIMPEISLAKFNDRKELAKYCEDTMRAEFDKLSRL